jgi:serine/threonine-protein phosphatase CPPED1
MRSRWIARVSLLVAFVAAALVVVGQASNLPGVAGAVRASQGTAKPSTPFFFIQLTDPQLGMYAANANFAQETANLEFAVATVNRLRPAFVVVTGDLVNRTDDAAQTAEYLRILAKIDPAIPVHSLPGNHDVGNEPTPESIAAYTKRFGPDHYAFRLPGFVGIVLDSGLVHAPQKAQEAAAQQEQWLRAELTRARAEQPRHIVVFQHHPLFLKDAAEADSYDVIPQARRGLFVTLFHDAGVRFVFDGHYHQNVVARDGDLEVVTTGPIGMPLRGARSGVRIAIVSDAGIEHRYYELGELPNKVTLPK